MGAGGVMLQGICIDSGQTAVLAKGATYYLFPNGSKHYYVSKFPNQGAHRGCYSKEYFKLIEQELWPEEPQQREIQLDPDKVYRALLIWRRPGYKGTELKEYYLKSKKTHAYFYHDEGLTRCAGCFPLHWFAGFEEIVESAEEILDIIDHEVPDFDIKFHENKQFLAESEPEITNYQQLSLFDI